MTSRANATDDTVRRPQTGWPPLRPPVAVVQPLPGIGDMVWHLPHIRAIAAHAGAPVTVLTKPRSLADQLLAHEAAVSDIVWLDLNPSGRRGVHDGIGGFLRLAGTLRARRFGSVIVLHHSDLLAAACWFAGIADRRGYGWGRQRWFLNNGPFLPRAVKSLHQHARATRYLAASGIRMTSAEPTLAVPPALRAAAMARIGDVMDHPMSGPFVAFGIGASEVMRQWGTERFAALAAALLDAGWPAIILAGGPEDALPASTIRTALGERAHRIRLALGWHLAEITALLSQAAFCVANNTGIMNIAAATGVRTYGLTGTTEPFDHARDIVFITVRDSGVHDGVARVTLDSVIEAIRADRGTLGIE